MNPDPASPGAKFRARRMEMKITLREIAQVSGFANTHLSMLEHGKRKWNDGLRAIYEESLEKAVQKKISEFQL